MSRGYRVKYLPDPDMVHVRSWDILAMIASFGSNVSVNSGDIAHLFPEITRIDASCRLHWLRKWGMLDGKSGKNPIQYKITEYGMIFLEKNGYV